MEEIEKETSRTILCPKCNKPATVTGRTKRFSLYS
jgi:hypothetical protein